MRFRRHILGFAAAKIVFQRTAIPAEARLAEIARGPAVSIGLRLQLMFGLENPIRIPGASGFVVAVARYERKISGSL